MGEGLDYAEGFDVADQVKPEPGTVLVITRNTRASSPSAEKPTIGPWPGWLQVPTTWARPCAWQPADLIPTWRWPGAFTATWMPPTALCSQEIYSRLPPHRDTRWPCRIPPGRREPSSERPWEPPRGERTSSGLDLTLQEADYCPIPLLLLVMNTISLKRLQTRIVLLLALGGAAGVQCPSLRACRAQPAPGAHPQTTLFDRFHEALTRTPRTPGPCSRPSIYSTKEVPQDTQSRPRSRNVTCCP